MSNLKIVSAVLLTSLFFPSLTIAQTSTLTITPTAATTVTPTTVTKPGWFQNWGQFGKQFRGDLKDNRRDLREDLKENRQDVKKQVKETREDLREIRKNPTGTITQDKNILRRRLLTTSQNGLLRSFTVRATALEKYQRLISDRITQKLVKFPGNQDLIKAQTALSSDEQKALWATFNADVAKYEVSIKAIATASDPKSLLSDLKSQAKKVNEDIKAIRQFLVVNLRLVVRAK